MMAKKEQVPAIRFQGFADPWEQRKLSEVFSSYTDPVDIPHDGYERLGIRSHAKGTFHSYVPAGHELQTAQMHRVAANKFIVNITFGWEHAVAVTDENDAGKLVSHRFPQFSLSDELDPQFLKFIILDERFRHHLWLASPGGAGRNRVLNLNQMLQYEIQIPCVAEQRKIAGALIDIDTLITLHQRKYDKLVAIKRSMLEKMFPREGSRFPEIRFAGFTDPWEQRKFSELVQIERGGSPRPIDDFITDAPNGLNWVKIGDAPTQGNYITKTAEKIRPEGLSKTREVHPGDLILSNSMSFGKPYIMGIDGCIHDGWLLIRNTYGVFDLTFLCHLLGTPQMLSQYRSLAAGSTVNNLNKELVGNTVVTIPSITEQRVLGDYLEQLDNLITLHQRKLEKLQAIKRSMLEKMFV